MNPKKSLPIILTIVVLMSYFSLDAMENSSEKKQQMSKTHLASTPTRNGMYNFRLLKKYFPKLYKTNYPQESFLRLNCDILTDKKYVQELITLHEKLKKNTKKNQVHVLVNGYKLYINGVKPAIALLLKAQVPVRVYSESDDHWKAAMCTFKDNSGQKQTLYAGGSSNASNNAKGSIEIDTFVHNCDEVYQDSVGFFEKLWKKAVDYTTYSENKKESNKSKNNQTGVVTPIKSAQENVLKNTPPKQKFLSTKKYAIWESIIQRFEKMQKGDEVVIGSYTFNCPSLVEKMCLAAKNGVKVSLYMDPQSLSNVRDKIALQIEEMVTAGVQVYVHVTTNSSWLFHAKFALFNRKNRQDPKENKKIVISTSQNAVERNPLKIEAMLIDPNNEALLQEYKNIFGKFVIEKPDTLKGKKTALEKKEYNKKYSRRFVLLEKTDDIADVVKFLEKYSSKPMYKNNKRKKTPKSEMIQKILDFKPEPPLKKKKLVNQQDTIKNQENYLKDDDSDQLSEDEQPDNEQVEQLGDQSDDSLIGDFSDSLEIDFDNETGFDNDVSPYNIEQQSVDPVSSTDSGSDSEPIQCNCWKTVMTCLFPKQKKKLATTMLDSE